MQTGTRAPVTSATQTTLVCPHSSDTAHRITRALIRVQGNLFYSQRIEKTLDQKYEFARE